MNDNEMIKESEIWLSVIVPIYNAEKYLKECLDSIKKQTFINYEVIMVDDGSVDNSCKICHSYESDKRFKYLYRCNGGSLQARIYGVEHSNGEYFTFCDADDYYATKDAFKTLYEEISNSKVSVIQFGYKKKYNHLYRKCPLTSKKLYASGETFIENEYPKLLCSHWQTAHLTTNVSNKVYKKKYKDYLPESKTIGRVFWGDDLIMNLYLLSECDSICFIPKIIFVYRQFSGETSKFSLRTMSDLDTIKKYQLQFLGQYKGKQEIKIRNVLFSEIAGWLYYYVRQGLNYISESEMKSVICKALEYPSFKLAKEYFNNNENEKWDGAILLKSGDADEYIRKAKVYRSDRGGKAKVIEIAKRIYTSI